MRFGYCVCAVAIFGIVFSACGRRSASPVCTGGAYLNSRQFCHPQPAPTHNLPFPRDFKTRVNQGFHGLLSHSGNSAFAVDFECEFADPVAASRSGTVVWVKEDSNQGCADRKCAPFANFILIDHGDGTYAEYSHLAQFGSLVDEGDVVCDGEVIGLCGSTGFATAPHLHFAVTDLTRRTIPIQFVEAKRQNQFGFAIPKNEYVSENKPRSTCSVPGRSVLPRDAFAHHGVMLKRPVSTNYALNDSMQIKGRFFGNAPRVSLMRKSANGKDWINDCQKLKNGKFRFDVDWNDARFQPGENWIMVTGADENCAGPKFAWSYQVWLQ